MLRRKNSINNNKTNCWNGKYWSNATCKGSRERIFLKCITNLRFTFLVIITYLRSMTIWDWIFEQRFETKVRWCNFLLTFCLSIQRMKNQTDSIRRYDIISTFLNYFICELLCNLYHVWRIEDNENYYGKLPNNFQYMKSCISGTYRNVFHMQKAKNRNTNQLFYRQS